MQSFKIQTLQKTFKYLNVTTTLMDCIGRL